MFQEEVCLEFGTVKVGETASMQLNLFNPSNKSQSVEVDKVDFKQIFFVPTSSVTVAAGETAQVQVLWKPTDDGNYRSKVTFKLNSRQRLQIVCFGKGQAPKSKKKPASSKTKAARTTKASRSAIRAARLGNQENQDHTATRKAAVKIPMKVAAQQLKISPCNSPTIKRSILGERSIVSIQEEPAAKATTKAAAARSLNESMSGSDSIAGTTSLSQTG